MTFRTRRVWASLRTGRTELLQLLQGIVAVELMHPSEEFWLVSPWISNIELLPDPHGRFRYINPSGAGSLDMVTFLSLLQEAGTRVTVVTLKEGEGSRETELFLRSLESASSSLPYADNLRVLLKQNLEHAKGLLGDTFQIYGSMNFTYRGLHKNTEIVSFSGDPTDMAWLKDKFEDEYGAWQE